MSVFAEHIDTTTGQRHRCVLLDERHLRCLDCARTLVLPTPNQPGSSTSTSPIPPTRYDECPTHDGQWRNACGPCRSERIARPDDAPRHDPRPTADVAAGIAALRAAFTEATTKRADA